MRTKHPNQLHAFNNSFIEEWPRQEVFEDKNQIDVGTNFVDFTDGDQFLRIEHTNGFMHLISTFGGTYGSLRISGAVQAQRRPNEFIWVQWTEFTLKYTGSEAKD